MVVTHSTHRIGQRSAGLTEADRQRRLHYL